MSSSSCMQAGAVVTAEPEVRQVTLPVGGGRLVLASDGLWDAVNPKTAMHHVRAMPASKAATELVRTPLPSYRTEPHFTTADEWDKHQLALY